MDTKKFEISRMGTLILTGLIIKFFDIKFDIKENTKYKELLNF